MTLQVGELRTGVTMPITGSDDWDSAQCQTQHAQPSSGCQFPRGKMGSQSVFSLLLLLLVAIRRGYGCMSVPELGPGGHSDNRGDIFSHDDQPDFGFEGFQHDGFGFDFGEGFSHLAGEDGGYERRARLRHRPVPVYEEYEDRQEEEKVLILKAPGGEYDNYYNYNKGKTQFDYGF